MATDFESRTPNLEEPLRRMYGPQAVFSKVGDFTLVHLDRPSEELIAKRVREFDPGEFFYDDCPLCQMAMRDGGHVVFDGDDIFDDADLDEPGPVGAFAGAVAALAVEASGFADRFGGAVSDELERRYFDDVHGLSDRIVEVLWGEESERRVELFDDLVTRARATVDEVCAVAPALAADSVGLRHALGRVVTTWTAL